MNNETFLARVERLREVNSVLEKIDPSIREEAFALLRPYVIGHEGPALSDAQRERETIAGEERAESDETFFQKFNHDKPSDNAMLIAAHIYSRFGNAAFSIDEVREVANDVGLTVPDRIDMTYAAFTRDGKSLFRRAGRGQFRPTVHGEAVLKSTYSVKKGTEKRQEDNG